MFTVEELVYIKDLFDTAGTDVMSENIVRKIEDKLKAIDGYDKCLWRFSWSCRERGDVDGVFKATKKEVKDAIGKQVYFWFGEVFCQRVESYGQLKEDDLKLMSDNPLVVINAHEDGYNPLEYIQHNCLECGEEYSANMFIVDNGLCYDCEKEREYDDLGYIGMGGIE